MMQPLRPSVSAFLSKESVIYAADVLGFSVRNHRPELFSPASRFQRGNPVDRLRVISGMNSPPSCDRTYHPAIIAECSSTMALCLEEI
jgi:hypothetical protein